MNDRPSLPLLDPVLLRTFLVVAQAAGFSEGGRRLGLRQSTVSQQIRRLEESLGRRLFVRDTHSVSLTGDGEALLEFARGMRELEERARRHFAGAQLRGRVRFGAAEDFVLFHLSDALRGFVAAHPAVDVELTVGLSGMLHESLAAGHLDLVLAKRRPGATPREETWTRPLWRDELVWAGRDGQIPDPDRPLPLVLFSAPSVSRAIALHALEQAGRAWHVVCSSASLSGVQAAVQAGLGLAVQMRTMIPAGLRIVSGGGLPPLGEIELILAGNGRPPPPGSPVAVLADAIADATRFPPRG